MGLTASGLVLVGSFFMPESDGLTAGGIASGNIKMTFDDAAKANVPSGKIGIYSSLAGDNCQVFVHGRNAGGNLITDLITVNGTTPVSGASTFERILKIAATGTGFHNGFLVIRDELTPGGVIATMESGYHTIRRPFYNVSADAAGGSSRDFYEKTFIKNTDSTYALLGAMVHEISDPNNVVTFALGNAQNDNTTTASRLNTVPASVTAFDSAGKAVPNTDLNAGSGIAVWLKLTLAAGLAAAKTTYTVQASGSTI